MGGGPPGFPQGFSCPVVLWILLPVFRFRLPDFHRLWFAFPKQFDYLTSMALCSPQPRRTRSFGLACFPFARRYSGNRVFFLLLPLLRCFSSRRIPSIGYVFTYRYLRVSQAGFPIRTSPDRWLFAPPRSFSQLITSFIGS